jgi:hypothetical protein
MNAMKLIVAAVLLFCVLVMLGFGIFSIVAMVNQPSSFGYEDWDTFEAARSSHHWMIQIISWITFFLMGLVATAALIFLPAWWRKALAAWAMFTCFAMFVATFFISGHISFDEIGWLWIIASLWMAFLYLAMGVSAFIGGKKKEAAPTASGGASGAAGSPSVAAPG